MPDVVVCCKLRREPVERVGDAGPDRDEDARGTSDAAQGQRRDRNAGQYRQCNPEADARGVVGLAVRSCQREQRRPGRDRAHREDVARCNPFVEAPAGNRQQEDEANAQQRLDERQRRSGERDGLQRPAGQAERRSCQPVRPPHEPAKQRESQRQLDGRGARLCRLQRDPDRIEGGRRERSGDPDHEARHGRRPR